MRKNAANTPARTDSGTLPAPGINLAAYSRPDLQSKVLLSGRSLSDLAFSSAPTIAAVIQSCGRAEAALWVKLQIDSVNSFAGTAAMDDAQISELARIIMSYSWLNLAELLMFFGRLKRGDFGRFYGTVDPFIVTDALHRFISQRQADIDLARKWSQAYSRQQQEAADTAPRGAAALRSYLDTLQDPAKSILFKKTKPL